MTTHGWTDSSRRDEQRLRAIRAEQLAQDHDAARPTTDLTDAAAQPLVNGLLDKGVVRPVAERRVLVHDPSGKVFNLITQLAVFHRGWTATRDADAEES